MDRTDAEVKNATGIEAPLDLECRLRRAKASVLVPG